MAAGNAESATNGVTGVGSIEVQARQFRDSGQIENLRVSIFLPALTGHSACASFPAAISCSLLLHLSDLKILSKILLFEMVIHSVFSSCYFPVEPSSNVRVYSLFCFLCR